MRRPGCLILVIGLAVAAFVAFGFVHGWTEKGPSKAQASFTLKEGETLKSAATELKQQGLIRSAGAFLLRARLLGSARPVKAGEYLIPKGASNSQILRILQGGLVVTRLVTIPEGMPSIMVHDRLMAEKELTGDIPVPVEGSILPDSYAFEKGETRAAVLARMQKAMSALLTKLWAERDRETAVVKTPQEALTLASIVEKETAIAKERPMVAAVYGNRLKKGMRLQADPTIIYPITRGRPLGRRILQSEIHAVNAYNTYAMAGLPAGPIANPGRLSIAAVLHPARTQALYFVADGQGGHIFADTLEQHNANVRHWFEIRRQRGEL